MSAEGPPPAPPGVADSLAQFDLAAGAPVILFLHGPKEKIWGLLLSLGPAGIVLRGIELSAFDEWMRQEARGDEPVLGLLTLFYPLGRVERLERDETVGPVLSFAERFRVAVGRSVEEAIGLR